ncbi:MAG: GNAT family N-acetyltransferase [Oscillospiraceae bacterium]
MKINIRKETIKDYKIVEELTREAFWNLYVPGCNEHLITHKIRNHSDFIPELSFVIEVDDEIIGSIIYSHSKIVDKNNNTFKTITFGPVFISENFRNKGLCKKLINHSIDEAKKLGFAAIVIGGYPYHYKSYGFVGSKKYNISMPDENFYTGIMALPLYNDALKNVSGSIYFSESMNVSEDELKEFEKNFSIKEKYVTESQKEFEKALTQIDTSN